MNLPFSFPVTLEAFMSYHKQLVGHELPAGRKALVEKWFPAISDAYEAGLKADFAGIKLSMDLVDGLIKSNLGKQGYVGFLEVLRCWIAEAWEQGIKDAEKEAVHK